jgi:drug/metabolite transporter (DMT)-like permease
MLGAATRSAGWAGTALMTSGALVAFAANSLLCRIALEGGSIDAPSFASIRIVSGAVLLLVLLRFRSPAREAARMPTDWIAAGSLIVYLLPFTFAYLTVGAAAGALLLFGAAQLTMFAAGLVAGERFAALGLLGFGVAAGGFVYLLLPGAGSPPLGGALLMTVAGIAWGVYSLRGRLAVDPVHATARNFVATAPWAVLANIVAIAQVHWTFAGVALAVASGALASALGYVVWYRVLPRLPAITAATAQLAVPVLAALGGVIWLAEPLTAQLGIASVAILGGVALLMRPGSRI